MPYLFFLGMMSPVDAQQGKKSGAEGISVALDSVVCFLRFS
jgi:hypothetical protein